MSTEYRKQPACEVRLDRLRFAAESRRGAGPPAIEGFRVTRNTRVKAKSVPPTYQRVQVHESTTNEARVFVQYKKCLPFLPPFSVTVVGDDRAGITGQQIDALGAAYHLRRPTLVELAFDFDPSTGIDELFVRRHALFGKTQLCADRGGPMSLRYGGRNSLKLVRAYNKKILRRYRVELELHAPLLRKLTINTAADLWAVADEIIPRHFRLAGIRWRKLRKYLARSHSNRAEAVVRETKRIREGSTLREALRYLKRQGVINPYRFLYDLRHNEMVASALSVWQRTL